MTDLWTDSFLETLRRQVPLLPAGEELTPATNLYDLGLDSMRSVQLLIALEETLDISIPDEMLTAEAFRTPGDIWALVQAVHAEQDPGSRDSS
ncbi:phosphopantetheine-binding protein [Plantactinospora veratri]|uniref:Phosphopantetheine-binding protein n=1 Tax=Plantactinospora veratri TaxID=1436122 RepID=A0ABU7S8W3_9ACTN